MRPTLHCSVIKISDPGNKISNGARESGENQSQHA
jgi:hypothetical protein